MADCCVFINILDDPLIRVCGPWLTKMGEGKAVSTKNLIATNLMVAGDSWVGKVMVCVKKRFAICRFVNLQFM